MQGFGIIHVKKPTTSAATDTTIVTATIATFPLELNSELVSLPILPPAVVFGKELGVPETVCAVVAKGEWASDEGFAVVVKGGGVSGAVCTVAVEEDGVTETADMLVIEEEKVSGTIDGVVVV